MSSSSEIAKTRRSKRCKQTFENTDQQDSDHVDDYHYDNNDNNNDNDYESQQFYSNNDFNPQECALNLPPTSIPSSPMGSPKIKPTTSSTTSTMNNYNSHNHYPYFQPTTPPISPPKITPPPSPSPTSRSLLLPTPTPSSTVVLVPNHHDDSLKLQLLDEEYNKNTIEEAFQRNKIKKKKKKKKKQQQQQQDERKKHTNTKSKSNNRTTTPSKNNSKSLSSSYQQPTIVNYIPPPPTTNTTSYRIRNLFRFCNPYHNNNNDNSNNNNNDEPPPSSLLLQPNTTQIKHDLHHHHNPKRKLINIGQLNSSHGDNTTIPQLLHTMRIIYILHILTTFSLQGYCYFWNLLYLQLDKCILSVYLCCAMVLLGLFELVRGKPIEMVDDYVSLEKNNRNIQQRLSHKNSGGSGKSLQLGKSSSHSSKHHHHYNIDDEFMDEEQLLQNTIRKYYLDSSQIIWSVVVEGSKMKQIRWFVQDNFGILFTCKGRGIFLCLAGGLSIAQSLLFMEILGISFILTGIWTIYLGIRYPLLENALVLDDDRNGDERNRSRGDVDESSVTWSSVRQSSRSVISRGSYGAL